MGRRSWKSRIIEKVRITGPADKGLSVGRSPEGVVIFVENAVPGDLLDVKIVAKKQGYQMGYPVFFHEYAEVRTMPFCSHFGVCGGCKWQHVQYEAQLAFKQDIVENAVSRIGKVEVREGIAPILPAESTTYYRNKLEFAFSAKKWLSKEEMDRGISNEWPVLGFHKAGAFDRIVHIDHCWLQPEPSNALRTAVFELAQAHGLSFYDLKAHEGLMRHIMVRTTSLGEVMLIVSFLEEDMALIQPFLDAVLERFPALDSLYYCINPKLNDYVLDLEMHSYHGKGYIVEQLGHVKFKIGPKSFFQTNTRQAVRLYDVVADFAGLSGGENVYDLYTGTGSIALYLARHCRQVVGIEEVEMAIEDARYNCTMNGIDNAVFYAGDVKHILTPAFAAQHGAPDVVITDPPRAGMHANVVHMLLELAAPRIVYVSCNPATQARDLSLLKSKYEVLKLQPVDMFPHTHHIESVALLALRPQA